MNQQNGYMFMLSLNLCMSCFLFVCTAVEPQFTACQEPVNCKYGPNISFPFYIQELKEAYCGYPGFGLKCSESGFPVLQISGNDYIVQHISQQNNTVQLQYSALIGTGRSTHCNISAIKNVTLDNDHPFNFISNQSAIHLLSKCNEPLPGDLLRYKIGCDENNWVAAMFAEDGNFDAALRLCKNHVLAPVEVNGNDRKDEVGNHKQLLTRGFQLSWTASRCTECVESGGYCGFNETSYHFQCFCPDRSHAAACPSFSTISSKGIWRKLILALAPVAATCIVILIFLSHFRKKIWWYSYFKDKDHKKMEEFMKNLESFAPKRYSYKEVKKITRCFRNKLGQGGYGHVYKGCLQDGNHVAVKVLKELRDSGHEEFINEVASISRTSHVNIVSLVGFCFEGHKRALIYEFMLNGSLEKFIYARSSSTDSKLGWPTLYKVAIGIARGLEYLHRGCNTRILHFDIKPHNVLLDENFCPKISDFGLSKLCNKNESIVSTFGARGTIGYIAPEMVCRNYGGVSHKSDVYSYGMMVLEMVGGRKNVDVEVSQTSEIYFPHWIYKRLQQDKDLRLTDILNESEKECARKMVIVSLWCIQTNPSDRPSMTKVVEMLEGNADFLQIPPTPFLYSPSRSEVGCSVVDKQLISIHHMSKQDKVHTPLEILSEPESGSEQTNQYTLED